MTDQGSNSLRRPGDALSAITGLRFLPQRTEARLVNISETGLLAESSARFPIGAPATVMFEGAFTPQVVEGRVARCEVAVMGPDGRLRYYTAIEFDLPLVLDDHHTDAAPAADASTIVNRW